MFKFVTTVLAALSGVALALALSIGFLAFADSNSFLSYSYKGGATYPPPMPPSSVPSTIRLISYQKPAASGVSLGVSPASYDSARDHQSYQVMVISHSSSPMAVHAALSLDNACSVELGRKVSWAALSGPASFTLAPYAERKFLVSVGQPPPGQSELIASFVTTDAGPGGVHTAMGVGTALRFSQPGHTVVAPCPKPTVPKDPTVHTVTLGGSKVTSPSNAPLVIAIAVLGSLLLCGAVAVALLFRRRPR